MPRIRLVRPVDRAGLALLASFGGWTLVSAAVNDGSRPWPLLLATFAVGVAVASGRAGGRAMVRVTSGPALALAGLGGFIVVFVSRLDIGEAGGGPLGYSNANGALFAGLGFAVVLVRVAASHATRSARVGAALLTAIAAGACVATGSVGATLAAATGVAVAGTAVAIRRRWAAIPFGAVVVTGTMGIVFAVALGAGSDRPGADTYGTRVQLWRGAADLVADHPVTGVGPGRFETENPVSTDPDLRRAHSAPLQVAAELGIPGLVLFVSLGGWVVAALWGAKTAPAAVVGAAAFTSVAVQSSFDWVLSEPTVLVLSALIVGGATISSAPPVSRLPRRLPGTPRSRLLLG